MKNCWLPVDFTGGCLRRSGVECLNYLGFKGKDGRALTVDGIYGSKSKAKMESLLK